MNKSILLKGTILYAVIESNIGGERKIHGGILYTKKGSAKKVARRLNSEHENPMEGKWFDFNCREVKDVVSIRSRKARIGDKWYRICTEDPETIEKKHLRQIFRKTWEALTTEERKALRLFMPR